jgi:hypothetical protein
VRGYTLQFNRGTGPANQAMLGAAPAWCPWGRGHHRAYRELLDHRVGIGVALRRPAGRAQPRHPRSRAEGQQRHPAPKIDYTISDNTQRMMEHGIARAEEILAACGATRIHCSRTVLNYPGHLLGTARMGTDPSARW